MLLKNTVFLTALCALLSVTTSHAIAQSAGSEAALLTAVKTATPPIIDGKSDDGAWANARPFVTYDPLSKIKVTVRAVYTDDSLYILASFPDKTENRRHKTQQ